MTFDILFELHGTVRSLVIQEDAIVLLRFPLGFLFLGYGGFSVSVWESHAYLVSLTAQWAWHGEPLSCQCVRVLFLEFFPQERLLRCPVDTVGGRTVCLLDSRPVLMDSPLQPGPRPQSIFSEYKTDFSGEPRVSGRDLPLRV